jgi:hypothetical protein
MPSPPQLLRLLPAGAVAGWDLHPLESAALSRRTPKPDIPRSIYPRIADLRRNSFDPTLGRRGVRRVLMPLSGGQNSILKGT